MAEGGGGRIGRGMAECGEGRLRRGSLFNMMERRLKLLRAESKVVTLNH